jgi:hypothetical protein
MGTQILLMFQPADRQIRSLSQDNRSTCWEESQAEQYNAGVCNQASMIIDRINPQQLPVQYLWAKIAQNWCS